jgi:anti-anti-sigma factor
MRGAEFHVRSIAGTRGFRLEGEFDLSTGRALDKPLQAALAAGGPLILDLRPLTFMDSSAIHRLIEAAAALDAGGSCLHLHVNEDGEVRRLLDLVGIGTAPNIHVATHSAGTGDGPSSQVDHA